MHEQRNNMYGETVFVWQIGSRKGIVQSDSIISLRLIYVIRDT